MQTSTATQTSTAAALPTKFDLYILYVADWDRAIAFYRDTLGWELAFEERNSWAQFATGGISLALHPVNEGETLKPVDTHLNFSSEDLDATLAALTARGVKITSEPRLVCDTLRSFSFADPFGNTFSVHGK